MRADSSVDNAKGITIRHHMQAKILDFFLRPSKRPKAGSPLRTLHLCKKYRPFRGLRKKGCGQTPVILQGNGHYARLQFCVFLEWWISASADVTTQGFKIRSYEFKPQLAG